MRRTFIAIAFCVIARAGLAQVTTIGPGPDVRAAGKVAVGTTNGTPDAQLHLFDIFGAGGKNLLIGDDAFFSDIDVGNVIGLYGNFDSTAAGLKLGSTGPTLFGRNARLGVDAFNPAERLQLGDRFTFHDGATKVLGLNFTRDTNDKRLVNGGVATIRFNNDGDLQFATAPPGLAGSAISYPSPGVIVDNQGRMGIGGKPIAQLELYDIYSAGGRNLLIGNDAYLSDIDDGNVLGLYGNWDNTIGGLRLGSNGPTIAGANFNVGIETRTPIARLHVNKSDGIIGEFAGGKGALLWSQASNATAQLDQATAAIADDEAIYLSGNSGILQGWRIEKRRKSDGALIAAFGSNGALVDTPLPGALIKSLAVRDNVLYVAGHNDTGAIDDSQWITEARDKNTGGLLWRKFSDPSPNVSNSIFNDTARAVVTDATSVYVAGRNLGNLRWRVEKRNRATGALDPTFDFDGVAEYDVSPTGGEPIAMALWDGDLYLAGQQNGWRIQRVSATTGAPVWVQHSVPTTSQTNTATAIAADDSGIYITGYEITGVNNFQWRLEKRSLDTGAFVTSFDGDGIVSYPLPGFDQPTGIAVNDTGLYISGYQTGSSSSNSFWKVERRDPFNGSLSGSFGTGGVVTFDPSAGKDAAYGIIADLSGAYVYGLDVSTGSNGQWRAIKLDSVAFQGFNVVAGGNVGIGTRAPQAILTVQKDSPTDPIADAWTVYSSRRWKTDIAPVSNALETIGRLEGVTFRWKQSGRSDVGLIAEDVGKVLPQIVSFEPNGTDAAGLDYSRLVPILIQAIKEQQKEIEELRARLP